MRAASIPARAPAVPLRSRRLLALAGDGRLVEQIRRGNDAAFEVVFERHGPAILAFCSHMLGSREEAEDAVQHTFAAAYRDLQSDGEREIALKPWLFAIARNRCLSLLRARREVPVAVHALESREPSGAGLAEQVEERADVRRLLADVRELPDEQRAALLLTELGDLTHVEVAGVLDCEVSRVKGLVFRARSALIARREAREAPCERIREQLANLRGGALRRSELRLHVRECPGCRAYREQVREQRRMLAVALPVAPTLGLKSSVLAAIGIGGGSAGGLATAAGGLGAATVAKVAVVGVLAGGGVVAGQAVVDSERPAVGPAGGSSATDRGAEGRATGAGAAVPPGAELGRDGSKPGRERMALERGGPPIDAARKGTAGGEGGPATNAKDGKGGAVAKAEPRGHAYGRAKPEPWSRGQKNGAKGSPPANGRSNQAGNGNGGPNGGAGLQGSGGLRGNGGPKANARPNATGRPNARGRPNANAAPPRSRTPNRVRKPSGIRKPNRLAKPQGIARPNDSLRAPAGPEARADAAPPAGAKPDAGAQTP